MTQKSTLESKGACKTGVKGFESEGNSLCGNRKILKVQVGVHVGIEGFRGGGESSHESRKVLKLQVRVCGNEGGSPRKSPKFWE
jgi:hypothetical protein